MCEQEEKGYPMGTSRTGSLQRYAVTGRPGKPENTPWELECDEEVKGKRVSGNGSGETSQSEESLLLHYTDQ